MSSEAYLDRHLHHCPLCLSDTDHLTNLHNYSGHGTRTPVRGEYVQDMSGAYWYPGVEPDSDSRQSEEPTMRAVPMNHDHPDALVPGKRQRSGHTVKAVTKQTADTGVLTPVFEVHGECISSVHADELSAASLDAEGSARVSESYKAPSTSSTRTESMYSSIVDEFRYLKSSITLSPSPCSVPQIESKDDDFTYLSRYIITGDVQLSAELTSASRGPTPAVHSTFCTSSTLAQFTPPTSPSPSTLSVVSSAHTIPPQLPPKPPAYMYQSQYHPQCTSPSHARSTPPTHPSPSTTTLLPPLPPKPAAYHYRFHSPPASSFTTSSVFIPPPTRERHPRALSPIDYEACIEDKYGVLKRGGEGLLVGRERREDGEDGVVLRVWSAEVPGWTF